MILTKIKLIWFIITLSRSEYNRVYLKQRQKGYEKYGMYLEDCDMNKYDWSEMTKEEIIDAMQYIKLI